MKLELIETPETNVRRITRVEPSRLQGARFAYTTRRVPAGDIVHMVHGTKLRPLPGDLVLARVTKIGKHSALESHAGRRATMFVGDEIVVAYGNRYAPDQFEAYVPETLEPCHLVAGGGVAARVASRNDRCAAPTEIEPIGLLADQYGVTLNLSSYALPARSKQSHAAPVIVSVGTSMNAGKTTSAAYLIKGLVRAGMKVGAAKITGTGSGNDPWLLRDAGASVVLDFVDAGHASTFPLEIESLMKIAQSLIGELQNHKVDAIVLEIADGLFQRETAALLECNAFGSLVDAALFSSYDSMGASAGVQWLESRGYNVLGVAGNVTVTPLGAREAAAATCLPLLGLKDLSNPERAAELLKSARRATRQVA
jgi:Domain of unknown function (DUF1611_C) P-loop domain